jgi:hypothetical protein
MGLRILPLKATAMPRRRIGSFAGCFALAGSRPVRLWNRWAGGAHGCAPGRRSPSGGELLRKLRLPLGTQVLLMLCEAALAQGWAALHGGALEEVSGASRLGDSPEAFDVVEG